MIGFILRRLLALVPVLLVVAAVVFVALRLVPGDPAAVIAGNNASSSEIVQIRQQLGLGRPLLEQFGIWVWQLLHGDLGYSFYLGQPVKKLIVDRIGPTLSLTLGTITLAVMVGLPLGSLAAARLGGRLDRMLIAFSVAGFSVPVFVVSYLLIWLFGLKLRWLPVQGYTPVDAGIGAWAQHLIAPCVALGFVYIALIARVSRASVSEALTEDYIRTAWAKGLPERLILRRHAVANAAVPIVTVIAIGIGMLIGGVVATETVFAIPGLGLLTVDAVQNRDFPLIQGLVLFFSAVYVGINLIVDLAYTLLDPRIGY